MYRSELPGGRAVALRSFNHRFDANANDAFVDKRLLLQQEKDVADFLAQSPVAVAKAHELVLGATPDRPDVLISDYIEDDGSTVDCFQLGRLVAGLHSRPGPGCSLAAMEEKDFLEVVRSRTEQRLTRLRQIVGDRLDDLVANFSDMDLDPTGCPKSLLHLDVRRPNLRCVNGSILALIDWSNAMVGDPNLELERISVASFYPENEIDFPRILEGYRTVSCIPKCSPDRLKLYRLDALVMLALVFNSEVPDPERGPEAVERLIEWLSS